MFLQRSLRRIFSLCGPDGVFALDLVSQVQQLLFSQKMKIILILTFFKLLISQQIPQLCSKATEYSNCALNATLQVAACNQNVDSNPDSQYYTCLCEGYQATLRCYSLCPDDPQLQLQFRTQKESTSSTCKAAGDMKIREPLSSSSSMETSSMSSETSSAEFSSTVTTSVFGQTKSQTVSEILGIGGSKALTPEASTVGSFIFFGGSSGIDRSLSWIIVFVAEAFS
jgi:hypothetical protein